MMHALTDLTMDLTHGHTHAHCMQEQQFAVLDLANRRAGITAPSKCSNICSNALSRSVERHM